MSNIELDFPFSQHDSLSAYEAQLTSELERITNRALAQWARNADSAFEKALALALKQATKAAYDELTSNLSNAASGGGNGASHAKLHNALSDLIVSQVNHILFKTRTTTIIQETQRSQNAAQNYRLSRTQQQADAAKNTANGQRNL